MATTKSDRFELRVTAEFLRRIDDWRRRQPDLPTRAAAVRQLVDRQLAAEEKRSDRRRQEKSGS